MTGPTPVAAIHEGVRGLGVSAGAGPAADSRDPLGNYYAVDEKTT